MNDIFKKHSYARTYINDVMMFNNSLKDHLEHLSKIFVLFEKHQIILKIFKTYFDYFSISLFGQKVNSFDFVTSANKLKTITDLSFSKTFKNLKTYFEMIEYFRDYVSYYAQKAEVLQQKKTALLKNDSEKKTVKKNFSRKTFMENSNEKKIKSYEILKADFSNSN